MPNTSELAEIRTILFDLKEDTGATRANLQTMRDELTERRKVTDALAGRIGDVEKKLHWYSGAGAALGMVLGFLGNKHNPFG